jgi:hypothetical protein
VTPSNDLTFPLLQDIGWTPVIGFLRPTLATVTPATGVVGTTVPVTLTGANLTGATLNPVAGITINPTGVTATQITATFNIATAAPLGLRNTTVTTPGGTSIAATLTVVSKPAGAAGLVKTDTTTQGHWKTVYGADGQAIANDITNYPLYAQVALTGQLPIRGPQPPPTFERRRRALRQAGLHPPGTAIRALVSIDINLTDGLAHQVALYCLDWDGAISRADKIDVLDTSTGLVLASSPVTAFSAGQYLVWSLSGHVTMRVTRTGALNGLVTGLLFK